MLQTLHCSDRVHPKCRTVWLVADTCNEEEYVRLHRNIRLCATTPAPTRMVWCPNTLHRETHGFLSQHPLPPLGLVQTRRPQQICKFLVNTREPQQSLSPLCLLNTRLPQQICKFLVNTREPQQSLPPLCLLNTRLPQQICELFSYPLVPQHSLSPASELLTTCLEQQSWTDGLYLRLPHLDVSSATVSPTTVTSNSSGVSPPNLKHTSNSRCLSQRKVQASYGRRIYVCTLLRSDSISKHSGTWD